MEKIKAFLAKALAGLKAALAFVKKYFKWWVIPAIVLLGFALIPHKDFKEVYSFLAGVAFVVLVWLVDVKFIKK
jgi:lipopolysaccharide export LptBFGC system permease protein LptF